MVNQLYAQDTQFKLAKTRRRNVTIKFDIRKIFCVRMPS